MAEKILINKNICFLLLWLMFFLSPMLGYGQNNKENTRDMVVSEEDTIFRKGVVDSTLRSLDVIGGEGVKNKIDTMSFNYQPYVSIQQILKGNAPGLYVQEPSGEPGTQQYMFVRGLTKPLFSKVDLAEVQPVIYIDGIPLINNSGIEFGIQRTEITPVGPANNLFAIIDPNRIESIEILKEPSVLAKLGPNAANGAIWIITKPASSGKRQINVESYFGVIQNAAITPVNASYENAFRQRFYSRYASINDIITYPTYLRDSTDIEYYGPATWVDKYYKNSFVHGINAGLTGGTEKANFSFNINNVRSTSGQDASKLDRYGFDFSINMVPIRWLTFSSLVRANRLDRVRNNNVRDRLSEIRYSPLMSNPLTPGANIYADYLNEFNKAIDDNFTTSVQGYFSLGAKPVERLSIISKLSVDYNENVRDVFWPSTLIDNNNFVSNYFGYNQRFALNNYVEYEFDIANTSKLLVEAGQGFQTDVIKYDYGFGYNTPNDFIKVRTINANGKLFEMPYFPLTEKMQHNLATFYGQLTYSHRNVKAIVSLRRDGSSHVQPDSRWKFFPSASLKWNVKNSFSMRDISMFDVRASYGRQGLLFNTDRYKAGPSYVTDAAWPSEPHIGSYVGIGASSRPYTKGWVGYGIGWQYSDKMNIGFDLGFLRNRINLFVDLYNTDNKNMILPIPVAKEYGYNVAYESGLHVNNKGVDLSILADIIKSTIKNGFNWSAAFNANYNINELKALPNGLDKMISGNTLLKVGKPIDAFWLLQNQGIYNTQAEIPTGTNGRLLSFRGIELNAGDPKWVDINNDNIINDDDKELTGNYMPKYTGGLSNTLNYMGFELNFQLYFALGHKMLNKSISDRFDFINNDGSLDPNVVKEIFFWQKNFEYTDYPMYNPWSNVVPYRVEQDLFLEDASFLKLRALQFGYDFAKAKLLKNSNFTRCMLYLSATNLFRLSKSNFDPELMDYNGYYTGYNQSLPQIYTIGFKLNF